MKKAKIVPFKFKPFSKKQLMVLSWWMKDSPVQDRDMIICDGSVRAGKTVSMALSYIMWAIETFNGENLGMSGKTIGSLRRNVIQPLKKMLKSRGYKVHDKRADNYLIISKGSVQNYFYLFGGKDESSQDLIQGITLAGMFFDEVALMPESFVNQATSRCSIEGSKMWFNCNPSGPYHWFKIEYLDKLEEKNALHIHFTMDDNLSLSERIKQRYKSLYSGIFYKRYILGLWVLAEGIIYDMFSEEKNVKVLNEDWEYMFVSVDYGIQNPMTYGMYGRKGKKYHLMKSYYHSGRETGKQKTDGEYADEMDKFLDHDKKKIRYIIVDPSATSFIAELRKRGYKVVKAKNDVLEGITCLSNLLEQGDFTMDPSCKEDIKEFFSYVWDDKAVSRGEEKPVKENDHCCDRNRYAVLTDQKLYPSTNRKNYSGRGAR